MALTAEGAARVVRLLAELVGVGFVREAALRRYLGFRFSAEGLDAGRWADQHGADDLPVNVSLLRVMP
jgi:hypothetical protein